MIYDQWWPASPCTPCMSASRHRSEAKHQVPVADPKDWIATNLGLQSFDPELQGQNSQSKGKSQKEELRGGWEAESAKNVSHESRREVRTVESSRHWSSRRSSKEQIVRELVGADQLVGIHHYRWGCPYTTVTLCCHQSLRRSSSAPYCLVFYLARFIGRYFGTTKFLPSISTGIVLKCLNGCFLI